MVPYFETVKSFADVPITDDGKGIDTKDFLEASDGLCNMFDLVSTTVFSFVQSDIRTNLAGVRDSYNVDPSTRSTLDKLLESEKDLSKDVKDKKGTGCLRRLVRGLTFTHVSLQTSLNNPNEELYISFKRAYDIVLKHHHNIAIRTIVSVALRSTPYRAEFYKKLIQGGDEDKFYDGMRKWLDGLGRVCVVVKDELMEREGRGEACGVV